MAYIGVSPSNGVRRKHTYTATASQTSFSGAGAEGATLSYTDSNFVDVYQNGVKLAEEDYTATSGTAIVLAQGASADDVVEIIVFDVFSVADTVSKSAGGTFDGNVTMAGSFGVSGKATAPSSPSAGDLWFNSASSIVSTIGPTAMAVYNGSSWDQMSNTFTATGGTESTYSRDGVDYKVHTFTSSGTFTVSGSRNIDYLVVAGGGAGGEDIAGGGGAGGYLSGSTVINQSYSIVIGAGGAATQGTEGSGTGNNGNNTTGLGFTAIAGGSGGGEGSSNGVAGGSGGGGGFNTGSSGSGTAGQGNAGGSANNVCGGGGGSAAVGQNGGSNAAGAGGAGTQNNIDNNNYFYAGGGGASGWTGATSQGGAGGAGGGGGGGGVNSDYRLPGVGNTQGRNNGLNGNIGANGKGGNAGANTGGGGGGAGESNSSYQSTSGAGGSGIIVIRYAV